jgi:hypothetical protein
MQSTNGARIERIKQTEELKGLISKLWEDGKLQEFVKKCDISKQPAFFYIDNHTELQTHVKQRSNVSMKQHYKGEAYVSRKHSPAHMVLCTGMRS